MIDQGIGFKNRDTNAALTLPANEVKKAVWFKGVRGPTVRIGTEKGGDMDFEALPKDVSRLPSETRGTVSVRTRRL
jgi:hypothetical protein